MIRRGHTRLEAGRTPVLDFLPRILNFPLQSLKAAHLDGDGLISPESLRKPAYRYTRDVRVRTCMLQPYCFVIKAIRYAVGCCGL